MFIINITYKTDIAQIEPHLEAHIEFLDKQYELGNFLASGAKVPRTGGIILANVKSKSELQDIIELDPFKTNDLADYELIEFIPSKTCNEMAFLINK